MKLLASYCPVKVDDYRIYGRDGTWVASPGALLSTPERAQIARDIVTAVNHHEALVNALQRLLRCLALHLSDLTEQDVEAYQEAEEVLARTRERPPAWNLRNG